MSCTCRTCNGIMFEHDMNLEPYKSILEEPAPKSVHDRLGKLLDRLDYNTYEELAVEIREIMEEVDSIDSDITRIKGGNTAEIELGEISKRLY